MALVAGRTRQNAPIDLVQLATNTLGNRDLEVQVLHLFKTQSCATLERLESEEDQAAVLDLVHTLKGSARAVGALRVAQVCEALETDIKGPEHASTDGLVAAVKETNSYISDLLEG
ncbi:Hpt domain-containing protein [Roseibium denhamense]|nr:Hpt domain-containing protein [Roseibium denhamense]